MDSEKHAAVTGSAASINPKVGGKFTAWDGYISGKNLELERGKKIVQEWMTTEWPEGYPPSRLELTFAKVKDGTEITVVHSDVPADDATAYDEGGYEFYWDPMKLYFKK
jgi:activator of HSP90 ATPase